MPSYTHLRRAMPVLVSHFFLAHVAALRRDYDRLGWASQEADAMPLGSGAVAGTNYAMDTAMLASRLGFSRVVANSIDASSDRDFVAAFLHACAMLMVHLSRLSEDLIIFCDEEHGFFQLSDASSTGSSMMPQKKNPDPLELIRGKSGRLIGHLTGWMATMKGLPSGYNKDLQEDKEAVFDAEDTVAGALATLVGVIDGLEIFPDTTQRRRVGTAACHRRRRFSRRQGDAVSRSARGGRRDGAPAARRAAGFRRADACRMAAAQPALRRIGAQRRRRRRRPFAHARPRNPLSRKRFRPRWPKSMRGCGASVRRSRLTVPRSFPA